MFRTVIALLAITTAVAACAQNKQTTEETAAAPITGETFGEAVTADGAITFDELLAQLQGKDSVEVKLTATVNAVCQMKGCWMNISSDGNTDREVMVKFKDYGFFVPKDIAGRQVIMQGYAYREVTPVDELRHYAEDAGKSAEEIAAITEPKEELKFLASGVLLLTLNNGK